MSVLGQRHHVTVTGVPDGQPMGFAHGFGCDQTRWGGRAPATVTGVPDGQPMVFAHGFGCDQTMWRFVAPAFEDRYRVVLFDHVGAGESDLTAYSADRYASLDAYAEDVLEIGRELGIRDAVFVGHSVSAMIGVLA